MRALFRVDCAPAVGMGHAMRCIALAGQLGRRGADVSFASRGPGSLLTELCAASGYEVHALPESDAGWEDDAAHTLAILDAEKRPDWVVVDHYGLDARWERRIRPRCGAILAIDDLADREHDCDLLLDQNFHHAAAARYLDRVPDTCQMLLGPRYALLRAAFSASRPPARDGAIRRVLISYGGTDSTGETLKALSALALASLPGLSARVVIGPGNPRAAEIRERCARLPGAEALESVVDMSSLLVDSDIAIGAGGVSMWERCAMGVPSIVTAIARNQEPSSQAMGEAGLCIYLGTAAESSAKSIADVLRGIAAMPSLMRHIACSIRALVDGKGAERVADRMQWPEVSLRRAGPADCDLSFAWRNHPSVRENSRDSSALEFASHKAWFAAALEDESMDLLIIEHQGKPTGVLRFDIQAEVARCSVFLDPNNTGRGIGAAALRKGDTWLRERRAGVRLIEAEVLPHNQASLKAFANAGFTPARQVLERIVASEP